jgi:hypothetical protein
MKKIRGAFEKVPGSGIWWICYFDADGRKRREKAGRKSAAIQLYRKRKTEVMEGKKLPENFRATAVLFSELAEDVLEYSKTHKLSYDHDCYRMARLRDTFGDRQAEGITPQDFERWKPRSVETRHSESLPRVALAYISFGYAKRKSCPKSGPPSPPS